MVQIYEIQQQTNDITNYQTRVVEFESFQEYLQSVNERSLPARADVKIGKKHVNLRREIITFHFEHNLQGEIQEFVHFAQVIS